MKAPRRTGDELGRGAQTGHGAWMGDGDQTGHGWGKMGHGRGMHGAQMDGARMESTDRWMPLGMRGRGWMGQG